MSETKTAEEFIYSNVPKEKMNIAFYLESEYVKCLMQQYGEHYANQQNQELQNSIKFKDDYIEKLTNENQDLKRQVDILNFDLGAMTLELLDAKAEIETKDLIIKDFESLRKLLQNDCIELNKQVDE